MKPFPDHADFTRFVAANKKLFDDIEMILKRHISCLPVGVQVSLCSKFCIYLHKSKEVFHMSYLIEGQCKTDKDVMVLGHMAIIPFPVLCKCRKVLRRTKTTKIKCKDN